MLGPLLVQVLGCLAQAHLATCAAFDAVQHLIHTRALGEPAKFAGEDLLQRLADWQANASSRQRSASPAVMNKHAAERKPRRLPFLLARVSRTAGQRAYVCSARHRRSGVSVQLALAGRAVASTGSATEEASQSGSFRGHFGTCLS
jgi:hypothetical protein